MLSIKSINGLSHYTDWTIAHVHSGALGWNGMMIFGMTYWLLPRLYQTPLWSKKMAEWHLWIATIGILLYIVPIYVAGLTQGLMWRAMDESGRLTYPEFIEAVQASIPLWWTRILGGGLYFSGIVMLVVNHVMTWASRPIAYEVPVYSARRLAPLPSTVTELDTPEPATVLAKAPVLNFAKRLDVFSQMTWHRRWERLPLRFTVLVVIAVVAASLFEIIPTFLIRSNIPTIASVKPYTPLELAGRDIYVSEGCYNCHSQMIRPFVAETKRYGEYSKPGEFIYDRPFQWGSRRIGPDLAREGGKQSSLWHWLHFDNPQQVVTGSVMPSYHHLLETSLDFKKITDRVHAAHLLGAPYDRELTEAPEMAQKQAEEIAAQIVSQGGPMMRTIDNGESLKTMHSQAIALIAYLQRIGTDIFKPADAVPNAPAIVSPSGLTASSTAKLDKEAANAQ